MNAATLLSDISLITPELALAIAGLALLMVGAAAGDKSAPFVNAASIAALVAAGVLATMAPKGGGVAFSGGFVVDALATYSKTLIAIAAAATLLISQRYLMRERLNRFEYPILILFATLGMMVMVSARDLIVLYVGLELQSLALYVLAAFNRDSLRASEAGLKYFVLGALSSGLVLYGASLLYGFSGGVTFEAIAAAAAGADPASAPAMGLLFGLVFLICGLAFKVSAAPFHMWTPDVYEGAPTPATAFFAAAPKLAAMALIARVLIEPFPGVTEQWTQVIAAIACLSMIVGSFGALAQTNIKRLMAYSSIANMGFALVALSAGGQRGIEGLLVYMTIYLFSTIGVFACILSMRRREGMVEQITDLAGLMRSHPGLGTALSALLLSIAGIPPLAGFFGKFYAFVPALEAGLTWLVIVAVLMTVVAAVYYLRLLKIMWFDDSDEALIAPPGELGLVAGVAAALMFPIMLLPPVASAGLNLAEAAAASLF